MKKILNTIESFKLLREINIQRAKADILMEEVIALFKMSEDGRDNESLKLIEDRIQEINDLMGKVQIEMERLQILTDIHQQEVND